MQRDTNYNNGGGNRMDVRQRGNATQLLEKYKMLARDATQNGDRVAAEYYMQHADHYYRVLNDYRERQPDQRPQRRDDDDDNGDYASDAGQNYGGQNGYAASSLEAMDDSDGDLAGNDSDGYRGQPEVRRDEPRAPRRDQPRQDAPRSDRPRNDQSRNDQQRNDQPRNDQQRSDPPRPDQPRAEARPDQQRPEQRNGQSRSDGARAGEARGDTSRNAVPRRDAAPAYRGDAGRPALDEDDVIDTPAFAGIPGPARIEPARDEAAAVVSTDMAEVPVPRKRGRPRKVVPVDTDA